MERFKVLAFVIVLQFFFIGTVFAFSDIDQSPYAKEITQLEEKGIVHGVDGVNYMPNKDLTYAEGVQITKAAFDLNLAHFTFIKAPVPSDYFTNIQDDKWYSEAFIVSYLNDITIPKDVKAHDKMTRQQFAHMLFQAFNQTGDYMFIEKWNTLEDENEIDSDKMDSIQKLINANVISVKDGAFHPNQVLKRDEAAAWVAKTLQLAVPTEIE
ncbi:S-layer homology domain-containing protein [Aquibacillus salsiterrae]|uniref:S-layer homology domain-containing protein n=1 Tax=Aquibacillus salsiterrae TaxID=2950439 RepID=A0A9X3WET7_9BACI|nr:S-layer homology domain-containing protein [Aquibacillus salsiterrae]MDC3418520.1 S-layer homology domain-containing protein [Aquibacillus salsiterrae]